MKYINIEIKARSNNHEKIREFLKSRNAGFKGIYHQIDTYFKVNKGRLKLREGDSESFLIYYERDNTKGPKQSDIILCKLPLAGSLKSALVNANGVLTVVDKKREIYFIANVIFHIDTVQRLGTFIEIEVIDEDGSMGKDKLIEQCNEYLKQFDISESDLISVSYSDLLLEKAEK